LLRAAPVDITAASGRELARHRLHLVGGAGAELIDRGQEVLVDQAGDQEGVAIALELRGGDRLALLVAELAAGLGLERGEIELDLLLEQAVDRAAEPAEVLEALRDARGAPGARCASAPRGHEATVRRD